MLIPVIVRYDLGSVTTLIVSRMSTYIQSLLIFNVFDKKNYDYPIHHIFGMLIPILIGTMLLAKHFHKLLKMISNNK